MSQRSVTQNSVPAAKPHMLIAAQSHKSVILPLALATVFLIALRPVAIIPYFAAFQIISFSITAIALFDRFHRGVPRHRLHTLFLFCAIFLYFLIPGAAGKIGFPIAGFFGCALCIVSSRTELKQAFGFSAVAIFVLCLPGAFQYLWYISTGDLLGTSTSWSHGAGVVNGYRFLGNIVTEHLIYEQFGYRIYRFQGIFDEPGLLGTVCALLLVFRKFQLNSSLSIGLFCYGLASLSLAFVAILIIFVIADTALNRRYKLFAYTMLVSALLLYQAWDYREELPLISRLATAQSIAEIDNRSSSGFDRQFDSFLNRSSTPQILIGNGNAAHTRLNSDASTWRSLLYNYGLIGLGLYFYLILSILFQSIVLHGSRAFSPHSATLLICIMASFFQRPDIFNPIYFGLVVAACRPYIAQPDLTEHQLKPTPS